MSAYLDHLKKFPEIMKRRADALDLYDKGLPNEIPDIFYRSTLNAHRWGWHGQSPVGDICPACTRDKAAK